jgi:hypothetical protein
VFDLEFQYLLLNGCITLFRHDALARKNPQRLRLILRSFAPGTSD